jgi:hypothetical protein
MRRPPPPHAQVHLPLLHASEALALADALERVVSAIWRAHGDAMADLQASRGVETPRPPDAVWAVDEKTPDDCF